MIIKYGVARGRGHERVRKAGKSRKKQEKRGKMVEKLVISQTVMSLPNPWRDLHFIFNNNAANSILKGALSYVSTVSLCKSKLVLCVYYY